MKYVIDEAQLTAIADATREATGSSDTYTVDEMPAAIKSAGGLKVYRGTSTCLTSAACVEMIRNKWGVTGPVKVIYADTGSFSTYENIIMWLNEDNSGKAYGYNRGFETWSAGSSATIRMYSHNYYVIPMTEPMMLTATMAMMNSNLEMTDLEVPEEETI